MTLTVRGSNMYGRGVLAVVWFLSASGPLVAQHPVSVHHYSLETMDIGIIADTVRGVSLVAAPSLRTREGRQATKITWLRFSPDDLLQWLDSADAYLRAPVRVNELDGIRWAPRLMIVGRTGWLTVGRRIHKQSLAKQRHVFISDSIYSWRFEVSGEQIDSLLNFFLQAASISRLAAVDNTAIPDAICEKPDQPVVVEHQPMPDASRAQGRVAMQYVVDTTGRAEMDTFVPIFATVSSQR